MRKLHNTEIIDYNKILKYFLEDFPESNTITTASSMKILLRGRHVPHSSFVQMEIEFDELLVFEKIDALSHVSQEIAQALRKMVIRCLEDIALDISSNKSFLSKIVYYESIDLFDRNVSGERLEFVKMHEILSFVQKSIPESSIIDSGQGLKIVLGEAFVSGEKKSLGQIFVKGDSIILTPNMSYFSAEKFWGKEMANNMRLIQNLVEELDENSIFAFSKSLRLNHSFSEFEKVYSGIE